MEVDLIKQSNDCIVPSLSKEEHNNNGSLTSLKNLFETVARLIQETPTTNDNNEYKLSDNDKLELYGLYKHITNGPCDGNNPPSFFQAVARFKYNAWLSCQHYTQEQAMIKYVEIVASHHSHWLGQKAQQLLDQYRKSIKKEKEQTDKTVDFNEDTTAVVCNKKNHHLKNTTTIKKNDNDTNDKSSHSHQTEVSLQPQYSYATFKANKLTTKTMSSAALTKTETNTLLSFINNPFVSSTFSYILHLVGIRTIEPRGQLDISFWDLIFAFYQCFICCIMSKMIIGKRYSTIVQQIKEIWSTTSNDDENHSSVAVVGLSVRSLLDIYLCSKKYPKDSEIIVAPAINIPGMITVMQYHNLRIVPVDLRKENSIDIQLSDIENATTNKTVAIMIVHPFGQITTTNDDMISIRNFADNNGIDILEDCAEAFTGLSAECYKGSSVSDICFFSFGKIKTSTALGGGLAIVRNETLATTMESYQNSLYTEQQQINEYFINVIVAFITKCVILSSFTFGLFVSLCNLLLLDLNTITTKSIRSFDTGGNKVGTKTGQMNNTHHLINQIRKRPSPALLSVLYRRLKEAETLSPSVTTKVRRCRQMIKILRQFAPSIVIPEWPIAIDRHTFWLFPIVVDQRHTIQSRLLQQGFDVPNGSSQLCSLSQFGNCPHADKLMNNILYLPVASMNLSETKMQLLAKQLQSAATAAPAAPADEHCYRNGISSFAPLFISTACDWFRLSWKTLFLYFPIAALIVWKYSLSMLMTIPFMAIFAITFGLHLLRQSIASYYLRDSMAFGQYNDMIDTLSIQQATTPRQESDERNTNATTKASNNNAEILKSMFPWSEIVSLEDEQPHGNNKVIVTGVTGFVGSKLLCDLLRYRHQLSIQGGVIVICRPKRGKSGRERITQLLSTSMYSFLTQQEKDDLVDVVEGDVTLPNAGLIPADLTRLCADNTITHVINCAALVSFVQTMSEAAMSNITSSLNLQALTAKLNSRDSVKYVHISTAFVHGNLTGSSATSSPLGEDLFSLNPFDPIKIYQAMLEDQFYASQAMSQLQFPNTYTFSKCICEHLLSLDESSVNTIIIRPSIVGPAVAEPFEGWSGNRPSTIVAAACLYMSYQWNLWSFGPQVVPYIPVDVLSKFIVSKSFGDNVQRDEKEYNIDTDQSSDSACSSEDRWCHLSSKTSSTLSENSNEQKTISIYNAAWNSSTATVCSFSWLDFALAVCQLGTLMGHFDKTTAYIGLLVLTKVLPYFNPSQQSYKRLHNLLVKTPMKLALNVMNSLGYYPKTLTQLCLYVDLPLLFYPFMNQTFHFQSVLSPPKNFDAQRYVFSCAVAAHNFIHTAKKKKYRDATNDSNTKKRNSMQCDCDMSAYLIGGAQYRPIISDFWWALSQPYGNYMIRLAGFIFIKILQATCDSVTVDATSFSHIIEHVKSRRATAGGGDDNNNNKKLYIVLAPTHRSFFDFILISYLFFFLPELQLEAPFIAADEEFEQLPIIGWLTSYLGAFFIQRGGKGKRSSTKLTETLQAIKSQKMSGSSSGSCFEVFLEGKRSRDRRFVQPKTGFLRCLVESGGDHVIVPITISYEKIPEQNYLVMEASGQPRSQLSFISLLSWIKDVVLGKIQLGSIHIAANTPITLVQDQPIDYSKVNMEIQQRQHDKIVISNYHASAIGKLLNLDTRTVVAELTKLGCTFFPSIVSNMDTPGDKSELVTIAFQCAPILASLVVDKKPEWSSWLRNGLDIQKESNKELISQSLLSTPLVELFDGADEIVTKAIDLIKKEQSASTAATATATANAVSTEQIVQIAARMNTKFPPLLLLVAASIIQSADNEAETTNNSNIDSTNKALSKSLLIVSRDKVLVDSKERLGYWGYNDSKFVLRSDEQGRQYVTMTGKRYQLCGKHLKKLIPFIENEMKRRIDLSCSTLYCYQQQNDDYITSPCGLELSDQSLLEQTFSTTSFDVIDRIRHGFGHSQEDIFALRSGSVARHHRVPDAVVWPITESEVELLVKVAKSNNWCLIPYGGGTNVSHALKCPSFSQEPRPIISVDMKQMNKILWVNIEDGLAHVEAGITGQELEREMARLGYTIGHQPDSYEFSTLGGWIATKASGMKRQKYGNIEDIVKSVRVVGSEGVLFKGMDVHGRVAEGLDLCSLVIGSEGCVGIVTSAIIKIWPIPTITEFDTILLPTFHDGVKFVHDVSKLASDSPVSVRLLDNEHFRLGMALRPTESDNGYDSTISHSYLMKLISKFFMSGGKYKEKYVVCATLCYEGTNELVQRQKRAVKQIATTLYSGISLGSSIGKSGYELTFMIAYLRDFALTYNFLGESLETFVPWSKIESVVAAAKKCVQIEHESRCLVGNPFVGCRITQLYHEGVCIYFYICINCENLSQPNLIFAEIEHAVRNEIIKHGGSLSHHHGIGKIRTEFLKDCHSPALEKTFASIKMAMDKDNIFGARNGLYSLSSGGSDK